MADEYPLVSKWTTIFLYPFPFPPGPENKGSLNKTLQHAADRWKPYTLSPEKNLDELSYFFPYIQDFLCAQVDHFQFKETEKAVLEVSGYDDVAPKLTAARLHLFPLGIGILSLRIEGKTLVSFSRLLDFNSDFRYLTKAYKKHSLPQKIVLTIGAERLPRAVQDQSGIPPLLNDFLWEIGGVPKSQLLDNRMIVYSYAALKRDSLPQDCDLDDVFFRRYPK